jgi:hypothetical protein
MNHPACEIVLAVIVLLLKVLVNSLDSELKSRRTDFF